MKELQYPFDSAYILKKRKSLKDSLIEETKKQHSLIKKKIAILGGSTTHDIKDILELFLLDCDIEPQFYETEYGKYWEEAMFENQYLLDFCPDIIYIHTTSRNIVQYPSIRDSEDSIDQILMDEYKRYKGMWDRLREEYHCIIIQNNFEPPYYRLLGNKDVSDIHGRVNFVVRLNMSFNQYAQVNDNFYINDINYLSSCYGLQKWSDPFYWHMYKYALAVPAIPELAYNLSNIIKSIYGKNKKALVLDLDNTLWGGIVGEDGPESIEIGQETPLGEIYREFQKYLKECKELGILLNINSKNDYDTAMAGLNRLENILKPKDFIVVKANWNSKDVNLKEIAEELNIGCDSIVFVDDNPAERHIVESQVPGVSVPMIEEPESYITILDRAGYFEQTTFVVEDLNRNQMYRANAIRKKQELTFESYEAYLKSLKMKAEIKPFDSIHLSRIAQLTNKSNQFNLTTRRYSQSEIQKILTSSEYITLYGKLEDKFGDNGVVSLIIGHRHNNEVHIELWLMSCRVLKRNMELAMMDQLIVECKKQNIKILVGYYSPTSKNGMVSDFLETLGFQKVLVKEDRSTVWELTMEDSYQNKNHVIDIEV